MVLNELVTTCVVVFFAGAAALVVRLARLRWWRSAVGRQTAYTAGAYLLTGILAVTARISPNYPGRGVVRLAVWIIVCVIPWAQLLVLSRAQRGTDRGRSKMEDHHG
jgi:hypothetical protein